MRQWLLDAHQSVRGHVQLRQHPVRSPECLTGCAAGRDSCDGRRNAVRQRMNVGQPTTQSLGTRFSTAVPNSDTRPRRCGLATTTTAPAARHRILVLALACHHLRCVAATQLPRRIGPVGPVLRRPLAISASAFSSSVNGRRCRPGHWSAASAAKDTQRDCSSESVEVATRLCSRPGRRRGRRRS